MRSWDFNPADYELMPGDMQRIADLAECTFSHVYRWYHGEYKKKPRNEDLLMASMLVVITEREKLLDLIVQVKEQLESIKKQLSVNQNNHHDSKDSIPGEQGEKEAS